MQAIDVVLSFGFRLLILISLLRCFLLSKTLEPAVVVLARRPPGFHYPPVQFANLGVFLHIVNAAVTIIASVLVGVSPGISLGGRKK